MAPVEHRAIADRNAEAILGAAEGLLLQGKPLNFSAVAAGAHVSRPTVYSHFADRGQLLSALVERSVRSATDAMQAAEPERGRAADALARVVSVGWEHLARHIAIARTVMAELPRDAAHEHHLRVEALLEELIERGQARGEFRRDLSASWLSTSCLGIIHAAASRVASGDLESGGEVDALERTVVDLCIGPHPRRKRT